MNDDRFSQYERVLIRGAGLLFLIIAIAKIVAAEVGLQLFR
jgi:hypothetical protein